MQYLPFFAKVDPLLLIFVLNHHHQDVTAFLFPNNNVIVRADASLSVIQLNSVEH